MQRRPKDSLAPPTTRTSFSKLEQENAKKKQNVAIGVSVFVIVLLGVGAFLIWYFAFRKAPVLKTTGTSNTTTIRSDERQLYHCVLGECVPQVVKKNNVDIQHNLNNNVWFDNPQCRGPNWKQGDPPPCRGKFKCAPPPPSLLGAGSSVKGNKLLGNLCQAVPDSEIANECGKDGSLCSDSDVCQARCVAQFFTCPTEQTLGQTQCLRATGAALNSATTDVMLENNCRLLCTACFKKTGGKCANGGSCVPTTGLCECPVQWAGQNCQKVRYGTCFVHNDACSECERKPVNNCGPNAFPAFKCDDGGTVASSCTCVSVEDTQKGAPPGSTNVKVTDTTDTPTFYTVQPNPGPNFGCNGVPYAVCRQNGSKGATSKNSCSTTDGTSVVCSNNQCSSNDDCKGLCETGDGVCNTRFGKSMCECRQDSGATWNVCSNPVAIDADGPVGVTI